MLAEKMQDAIVSFKKAGGIYEQSKLERKSSEFDRNLKYIYKLIFSIGGFLSGYKNYIIIVGKEEDSDIEEGDSENRIPFENSIEIKSYRDKAFLDELKEIKIGEWRNSYTTERFGYTIYDGTQWELEIYYCNAKGPIRFSGSNSYPYNFNKFLELLKEVE